MRGKSRINTASAYRWVSLGIVRFHIGQGIDTVEVRGSSPLVPTILFSSVYDGLVYLGARSITPRNRAYS